MYKTQLNSSLVSAEWLNEHYNTTKLIVLDATINKKIEDAAQYITKAQFFDIKQKFSNVDAPFPSTIPSLEQFQEEARKLGVNQDSAIVIYDDKGIYSSARAWWIFKAFGFDNVAVLDGGLPEWKRLHYKTVTTLNTKNIKLGNFTANYQSNFMCFFEDVLKRSEDENSLILDARSEERFNKLVPEPKEGLRRGTIPNSKNLPFKSLFDGNCLKPKTELKSIFKSFKMDNKLLVFSCGSGITACILALAADRCGYNKLSVYDGSWTEYGTLTD